MEKLSVVQERAKNMIEADAGNITMFQAMRKMYDLDWALPPQLSVLRWIRKVVPPDPYDAVNAGVQTLTKHQPKPSINPLTPNVATREKYDTIERAVAWFFKMACQRQGNLLGDIVKHAVLFHRVAAQVIHISNEKSVKGVFKGEKQREDYAKRFGPFAVVMRDPEGVHAEWSEYGMERVLYQTVVPLHEMKDFWGEKNTKKLYKMSSDKDFDGYEYATIFDYQDYDQRQVWAVLINDVNKAAEPDADDAVTILAEKNDMKFIPWVVRDGAKNLRPLLYPIWKTKAWEDQCLFETIMASEVVAYAAAPRAKVVSFSPDSIKAKYGEVGGRVEVQPGDEDYEPLIPPGIDENLQILADRLSQRQAKSTIPNVIQAADYSAEWAFATLNLAIQSGLKSLSPFQELAEYAISDMFRQMFYWIDYTGNTEVAYPTRPEIEEELEGATKFIPEAVEQVEIGPGDFDPDHLYIDVELTADVPTDRMARVNAAVTMTERMQYPNRYALEQIGEPDPAAAIELWEDEQRRLNEFEIELQDAQMEAETAQLVDREAQLLEVQMSAQEPGLEESQGMPTGNELQQGEMMANPAMGGMPPGIANPEGEAHARAMTGEQGGD
jgi:hypothetical protein